MATSSNEIENLFPGLRGKPYEITSPRDKAYNCIAWAADETRQLWWPADPDWSYWPESAPLEETLAVFLAAFVSLGYQVCDSDAVEPGFEKVALFADKDGIPTHAARQLSNGRWTSKLGRLEDIEHDLEDLAGDLYGSVAKVVKRPRKQD